MASTASTFVTPLNSEKEYNNGPHLFTILFVAAVTIVRAEPQAPTGDVASRVENKLKTTRTRDSIFSELRNKAVVSGRVDENNIRKAVTFYASFDESLKADYGAGERTPILDSTTQQKRVSSSSRKISTKKSSPSQSRRA